MTNEQLILQKLEKMEKDIVEIKEHMVDVDTIISEEERIMLDNSLKHEKERKLHTFEEIENARTKAR